MANIVDVAAKSGKVAEQASKAADTASKVSNTASKAAEVSSNASKAASTVSDTAGTASKFSEFKDTMSTLQDARDEVNKINGIAEDENSYMVGMDAPEGYKEGQKVAPGKEVHHGKIDDSATKKVVGAFGEVVGVAADVGIGYLTGGVGGVASLTGKTAAKEVGKEAGKEIVKEAGKEIGKEVGKEIGKEALEQAAKEAGKEVGKEALEQVAKEAGKELSKEATEQAVKKGVGSAVKSGTEAVAGDIGKDTMKGINKLKSINKNWKGPMNLIGDTANGLINSNDLTKDVAGHVSDFLKKSGNNIADTLDKVPLVKPINKYYLVDFADFVQGVLGTLGALLNLNPLEAIKQLFKALFGSIKFVFKSTILYYGLPPLIMGLLGFFIMLLPLGIVFFSATSAGEFILDQVSNISTAFSNNAYTSIYGAGLYMNEAIKAVCDDVPDFDSLSNGRKVVVVAAATSIGTQYTTGGKPTTPGASGLDGGVDSDGLLEWIFWNVTGSDPGSISVAGLSGNSQFEAISESDLKPGDFGVYNNNIAIYMGNGNWVHLDSTVGVMRSTFSGISSFYRYKDIDTINVAAGDTGGTTIYYDGEGPSGSFRQKVIGWAQILHGMNIPYSNAWGYNTARSLDVNANNFGTIVPAGTKRGNGSKFVEPIDFGKVNKYNLKGLDCGGYAGYVYFLATGGKSTYEFDSYIGGGVPALFAEIPKEQAKQGDVVIMPGSHVMLLDHFEADGRLSVYEMSGCSSHTYNVNGQQLQYSGSTSVGAGCNGGYCKNHNCRYLTYIGPEN